MLSQVKIQFVAPVSLLELKKFLSGEDNEKMPQDAVQALDIVMQQMPSFYYTSVGQSFLPFDGQRGPLGEGCDVQFGFYSNVRHSEWKAMLVNIDGEICNYFLLSSSCLFKTFLSGLSLKFANAATLEDRLQYVSCQFFPLLERLVTSMNVPSWTTRTCAN